MNAATSSRTLRASPSASRNISKGRHMRSATSRPSQIAPGCNSPQRPTDLAEIIFPSCRRCTIMLRERRKMEHTL
jgi:hypothetical protein